MDTKSCDTLVDALQRIVDWKPSEYQFPVDWEEQIAACGECQGWAKNHPIQRGICDTHRRPIWAREAHDQHQREARGSAMWLIAFDALAGWRNASGIDAREGGDAEGGSVEDESPAPKEDAQ